MLFNFFQMQHTLLLCVLSHHILLHDSFQTLQVQLHYSFTDPSLLHVALTHPSSTTSTFMIAADHIRHALSNCGLRDPQFLLSPGTTVSSKGMKDLIRSVKMDRSEMGRMQRLQNNEQLEFLGDAVLEYICR